MRSLRRRRCVSDCWHCSLALNLRQVLDAADDRGRRFLNARQIPPEHCLVPGPEGDVGEAVAAGINAAVAEDDEGGGLGDRLCILLRNEVVVLGDEMAALMG